jgi:hypothetical protein
LTIKSGIFVWLPPPGAAAIAVEELRKAALKRQQSTHIFICPRLLTTEWRKQLSKASDLVLSLPAGSDKEGWPAEMLEPLTIAFVFPFLPFRPWQRRGAPKMLHLARKMSAVCTGEDMAPRDFLFKLFNEQHKLIGMQESLVRSLLYFTPRVGVSHKEDQVG